MNYEKFLHNYFKEYRIKNEWYEDNCKGCNGKGIISEWIKHDKLQRKFLEGNH